MKSLPVRPSLESLRKEAKKLARDRSLKLRDAQLQIAREYGFPGWLDLTAEVHKRLGTGLGPAAAQARRVIHENDLERLKQLLAEFPALLSWTGNATENDIDGSLVGMATGSYADAYDPGREEIFTRGTIAEFLIDAGATVTQPVVDGILQSRARGLLELFRRKGLLPRTLKFFAALGDAGAARAAAAGESAPEVLYEAFVVACNFRHETTASVILERMIAVDPELGARIDERVGRAGFIRDFVENRGSFSSQNHGPWRTYVMRQIMLAVDGDVPAFSELLRRESWLLGDDFVEFQDGVIGRATLHDRGAIIEALFALEPAILHRRPPRPTKAFEWACTYRKTHLLPLLTRAWEMPDDLPHAAATGNLTRVKQFFDETGAPALGSLENHYPWNDAGSRERDWLQLGQRSVQPVLDVAFAWAVINDHLEVADFLLEHGADINTRWGSHEPASVLHELVGQVGTGENAANYKLMKFLIDRGIDMTIRDYRWDATAHAWAIYAAKDETLAKWLEDEERRRAARR